VPAGHSVVNTLGIQNPVINSPFDEPCRHFRFSDEGITNEIVPTRRQSTQFDDSHGPDDLLNLVLEWKPSIPGTRSMQSATALLSRPHSRGSSQSRQKPIQETDAPKEE
jgi:hypothetical protein